MNVLKPSAKALRILITRTDRIGDLVLSTPVLSAVRKRYPDAWIACLTFPENQDIIRENPNINEVILYRKKDREKGIWENIGFALCLAKKNFDAVVHLHATNRMHLVSRLAGIPVRIGYSRKNAWALTHAVPDEKKEGSRHESDYNFDLLKFIDVPRPARLEPFFPLTAKAGNSFDQLFRNYQISDQRPWVVLSPSASCPSKRWPAGRFGELCCRIREKWDVNFFVIGRREDRGFVEGVKHASSGPVYDLSGKLTLGMLGHLLSRSALLISNDSGPVHIAQAVGTPVISIFGRNQAGLSPERWRPLGDLAQVVHKDVGCRECLAHLCQIHFLCLDAVSVEDVYEKVSGFSEYLTQRVPSHAVTA